MDDRDFERELNQELETDVETKNDSHSPFFGSVKSIVEQYSHCPLCGSKLHFTHVTDFALNLTQETVRCPECQLQSRHSSHRLQ